MRKADYTIRHILRSRKKVLTTRFYVSPHLESDVKRKLEKLSRIDGSIPISEIPLHNGLDEYINNKIAEFYSPDTLREELAMTTTLMDKDWTQGRVALFYENKKTHSLGKISTLERDIEHYLESIEVAKSNIFALNNRITEIDLEKQDKLSRVRGLNESLSEIELDGIWGLLALNENQVTFYTKQDMILSYTGTEDVLRIGKWALSINFEQKCDQISLVPFHNSVSFSGYFHPNVSRGKPCLGENKDKLNTLLELYRLLDITRFFTAFLTEYTHHNPYCTYQQLFLDGVVYPDNVMNTQLVLPHNYGTTSLYPDFISVKDIIEYSSSKPYSVVRLLYILGLDAHVNKELVEYIDYKTLYPDDCSYTLPEPEEEEEEDVQYNEDEEYTIEQNINTEESI